MIDKTVHWDPELRKKQQLMLESLPEDDRESAAYMIRAGNVALHYYSEREADPTVEDFEDWLTVLPENIANYFSKEGFEKTKSALALRRHASERNDIGMDAYMKAALSKKDYEKWNKPMEESLK